MKNFTLNNRLIHVYNFRSPGKILDFKLRGVDDCLADGLVVLDANVLLLPLATGALTLSAIERVLSQLISQNRLYVPSHALREYLANRSAKIKELIDQLVKKKEKNYSSSSSPLLQKASIFDELTSAEAAMKAETAKVAQIIGKAIAEIKGWETNDPVSAMYKGISLSKCLVADPVDFENEADIKSFLSENDERCANRVPPGFKDASKGENDIGDFLIWKTVLGLGKTNPGRDLTFVSGELKTDWLYRSAGQTLHVREELIEEYRAASDGGSFHLIDFATLLEKFKESVQVVSEVRSSEQLASLATETRVGKTERWSDFVETSIELVEQWLMEDCSMCNVGISTFNNTHLQGDLQSQTHLIIVRPLRHIEHVVKRVAELRQRVQRDLQEASAKYPLQSYRGGIVFVCESEAASRIVSQTINGLREENIVLVAGYLTQGKFRTT